MSHAFLVLLIVVAGAPSLSGEDLLVHAKYLGFHKGGVWEMRVAADGSAQFSRRNPRAERTFQIPKHDLQRLREAIQCEQFFAVASEVGNSLALDPDERTLEVAIGETTHQVTILGYRAPDFSHEDLTRMARNKGRPYDPVNEMRRAVRVWQIIQSWISDPVAANSEDRDKEILKYR